MEQQKKLSITLETVFWILTLIVLFGVLYPITSKYNDFPFLWSNILAIVVFVTYTRFIFLWKYTLFAKSNIIRIILLIATIPLVFNLISNMNGFQSHLDDYGYDTFIELLKNPTPERHKSGLAYIKSEYVFFSIAATIAAVMLPIRMIISFWRTKNNQGV